jgi:hypothetical protein
MPGKLFTVVSALLLGMFSIRFAADSLSRIRSLSSPRTPTDEVLPKRNFPESLQGVTLLL